MSKNKTYTHKDAVKFKEQRDVFAHCMIFAVQHFKVPGGGIVMREKDGQFETESWLTWFRRELEVVGIKWDDELLEYSRASKTDRKRMLKESPTLAKKLEDRNKPKAPTPCTTSKD